LEKWKKEKILKNEELQIITKQGKIIDVLLNVDTVYDSNGKPLYSLSTQLDITERKHAEENLRQSEEQFRTIVETAPSLLIITDAEGNNIYVSPNCEQMTGYKVEELLGKVVWWVHDDDLARAKEIMNRVFSDRVRGRNFEYKAMKKNGDQWWASSSWELLHDVRGNFCGVVMQTLDITERKKAEEALRESQNQLRSLADHLQSVRENERTAMAREIHDELGQALTSLRMDLSWLAKKIPEDQTQLLDKLHSMSELTGSTLRTVQRISTELRPGLLDDLGLVAAIEWQTEEFQNRTGIRCTLTVDPDITLDDRRSTALFRILQETLINVARHAQATGVTVSLQEKDGVLKLRVRDNGKGITKDQISNPKSFGLLGIQERVNPWGGEVKISGRPGKGTTVMVRMPIKD
jgi:PAS domain S-box-containing protein